MKKMRKGFTLVELLIVIAILSALAASMTINMSNTTAKAKAATIRANFDTCKTAAMTYYSGHIDEAALKTTMTAQAAMKATIPGWGESGLTKGVVKYTATGTGAGNWKIVADYTDDTAATEIATLLNAVDGITAGTGENTTTSEMKLIDELTETPAEP